MTSKRNITARTLGGDVFTMSLLLLMAGLFLLPIYMMIVNGLKPSSEVTLSNMWRLPSEASWGGFPAAWEKLSPSFVNSMQVAVIGTVISCLIGSVSGYVLSKWRFPYSNLIFALVIFGMFIPYQSVLIPLVRFIQSIGLYGTIPGLILVHVVYGLPINTLIFRNYYASVPDSLIEAARVDGAGVLTIFRRIILPISPPAFVVAAIFQFTNIWNDFLFGVTLVPNPDSQPVTVALNNLSGNFSVDWNEVMAGAIIAALPTALLYIVLGRFFMRGLMSGSVKA